MKRILVVTVAGVALVLIVVLGTRLRKAHKHRRHMAAVQEFATLLEQEFPTIDGLSELDIDWYEGAGGFVFVGGHLSSSNVQQTFDAVTNAVHQLKPLTTTRRNENSFPQAPC